MKDKLYWHAIRELMVLERRRFLHETSMTDIIRIKLLEKEMIITPVTPEHNALIERIFTAWTETSCGLGGLRGSRRFPSIPSDEIRWTLRV